MKCYNGTFGEYDVDVIDPVYRKIQFNAEYMEINGNDVKLYYPKSESKNGGLYVMNGKQYTSIGTNLFVDDFDNMIRSTRILLSHLNCYCEGWKIEECQVNGDVCVYKIDERSKITVYIDDNYGIKQISVALIDKNNSYGSLSFYDSERSMIEELNDIFDKYDVKKEVVQKDFELLTLDL